MGDILIYRRLFFAISAFSVALSALLPAVPADAAPKKVYADISAHRWPAACADMTGIFAPYHSATDIPPSKLTGSKAPFTGAEGAKMVRELTSAGDYAEGCTFAYLVALVDLREHNDAAANEMFLQARSLAARVNGASAAARTSSVASTGGGSIPTGQWHCFSGVGWDAAKNQPGIGGLVSPQFEGYLWIYDAHHYANMKPDDRGTYDLVGDELVAHSGPWVRVNAELHYKADGYFHRPTTFFGYKDAPTIHFACNPGH